jgi:hypothetical protein
MSIPVFGETRGGKGKKGRTVSDDAGEKSLSDTSTSAGVKSTAIRTSVNIFETSKRDKPQYFIFKIEILSSSSGGVVFLTPRTTRGSLLVICQLTGEKVQPSRIPRGRTLTRQWEKVEVMKRKTGNLRTTMKMGTGVEMLPNGQEHNGENCAASTSELMQWSGQLQTTIVTLLLSAKLGDMSTARKF